MAVEGVVERLRGRNVSRTKAAAAAIGAAVLVYRLLRSGEGGEEEKTPSEEPEGSS